MPTVKTYPDFIFADPPEEFDEDVVNACERIRAATKGWGADENELIDAMGDENADMRNKIYHCYQATYEENLKSLIKGEVGSDNFGLALQMLAFPLDEAEALMIDRSCQGLGTREFTLYPIFCARTNEEILKLKQTFFARYEKDLSVTLDGELGGSFEKLIFFCLQGLEEEYDPETHTDEKAEEDAETFFNLGVGDGWGTDEEGLFKMIVNSPPEHLEKVNEIFTDKHEITMVKALADELSGSVQSAAKYLVGMKLKPYRTAAEYIHKTFEGFGTDETALTFALIRYQRILTQVAAAYEEQYETPLLDALESEIGGVFGGKYATLLKKLVENAVPAEE